MGGVASLLLECRMKKFAFFMVAMFGLAASGFSDDRQSERNAYNQRFNNPYYRSSSRPNMIGNSSSRNNSESNRSLPRSQSGDQVRRGELGRSTSAFDSQRSALPAAQPKKELYVQLKDGAIIPSRLKPFGLKGSDYRVLGWYPAAPY